MFGLFFFFLQAYLGSALDCSSDDVFKQLETSENFRRDAGYNEHSKNVHEKFPLLLFSPSQETELPGFPPGLSTAQTTCKR